MHGATNFGLTSLKQSPQVSPKIIQIIKPVAPANDQQHWLPLTSSPSYLVTQLNVGYACHHCVKTCMKLLSTFIVRRLFDAATGSTTVSKTLVLTRSAIKIGGIACLVMHANIILIKSLRNQLVNCNSVVLKPIHLKLKLQSLLWMFTSPGKKSRDH